MHTISKKSHLAARLTGVALAILLALILCGSAHAASISWTGSTSTEWNLAGNWSSAIPGSGDDVTIPANVASGRYPVVSTAAANAKTVTLASGAGTQPTLTVSANTLTIAGNFTVAAGTVTHSGGTIAATAGATSITGTLNESAGTFLGSVDMTINSGGNVNVSGTGIIHMATSTGIDPTDDIILSGGGTLTQSAGSVSVLDLTTTDATPDGTFNQSGGTFRIYNEFKSSGTFDATAGTIEFAAAGGGGSFPLTLGPTQFFNVLISANPVFDNAAVSFSVAGDWTCNTAIDMSGAAVTVTFNGSGAQAIGGSATTTFRNVTINKSAGTATLGVGQIVKSGDLTVTAGTLDLTSYTMNRSAAGGTISVANGATLKIGGTTNTFPSNFTTGTFGATSTVEFYGSGAQTIPAYNYGNLTSSNSGARTLASSGTVGVAGTFTTGTNSYTVTGSTLSLNGTGAQTVPLPTLNNLTLATSGTKTFPSGTTTIAGNLAVSGTAVADATTNTTTVTLNGTSNQSVASVTFYNLTLNNSNGATLTGNVTVNNTMTFTSGRVTTASNALIIPSTGSVSRTSGHVVGNFQKYVATGSPSLAFEIGDASTYTPVTVTFESVSSAGNLTAGTTAGDHPNIGSTNIIPAKSVNRYWTLTNSDVVFTSYSSVFTFVAGDIDAGASTSNFYVGSYSGGSWSYPTVGTKTGTTTEITNVTSFSDFQIGEAIVLAWTGAVSTEWNTAGNWNSGSVPTSADVVSIPANVASGRYPVVSTAAASAQSLNLASGAGTQPALTVSDNTLTVAGNFTVSAGTVTHSGGTIAVTAGAVTITGTLAESGGTLLSSVAMTINNGANVTVSGTGIIHMASAIGTNPTTNITISAGGTLTQSGGSVAVYDLTTNSGSPNGTYNQSGGTLKMYRNFRSSGVFSASGGTIQFAAAGTAANFPATLGSTQFFNVVCDVDPNFDNQDDIGFSVAGSWTSNAAIAMSGKRVTVTFNGTGIQTVSGTAATTFYAVTVANTGSVVFSSSLTTTMTNTFTINSGTVSHTAGTIAAATVSVTGTLNESGGTLLSTETMTVNSGGNVNVSGTGVLHMASALVTDPSDIVTIAAGGTITQSGGSVNVRDLVTTAGTPNGTYSQSGGTLKLYRDFKNSGTFSATGGTIEFAANPSASTFPSTLGPTQFFNVLCTVDPDFDAGAAVSFSVAGNWSASVAVDMSGRAVTTTFNGSSAQTIGGAATTTFRNLTVNSTSTVTLTANESVKSGDLTVTAGTLDLASFTLNRSAAGGTITVSNGATLKIGGTNSFPSNYTTETLGATSTVDYYGTNQTVTDEDYGHLLLSTSGTKTMPGTAVAIAGNFTMSGTPSATAASALTVGGIFTVGNGCTFGAGSFSHSVAGNFVNGGTFTASTSTVTLNGSSGQTISGATATTFNNLTLNNSNGVTLSTSTSVSATLTLTSGRITTGSNSMIITSTGSVSRTSGHVVGNLQKNVAAGSNVSRTFEVGDVSAYSPLTAVFATVSVAGNLTCSTTSGDHPNIATSDVNASKSVNRYWTMTGSGGLTFTTHSTTFTFVAGDVDAGAATSNFIVRRWISSAWSSTTAGTRTATTTQITSQATLGDFQVGNVLSVAASNSVFAFGTEPLNTWLTAQSSVITNDGTETEAIVAQISTFTDGSNTWTLSSTANGADQARAQWSTTSASGPWTDILAYATNFTVSASLASSGTVTLYLRIQTPTSTTSLSQYSSTLTLTAQ